MDVIGAGGPLGSRQLLTAQSENTRIGAPGQAPGNRSSVRALQETGASEAARAVSDPAPSRTVRRASQSIVAAGAQTPDRPLPRGSLVNILV